MKRYVVMTPDLETSIWQSLDVDDYTNYNESHNLRFSEDDIIISFQVSDLIQKYKTLKISELPTLIDLESFDKQMSQLGNDLNDSEKWMALKMLKNHNIIDSSFDLKKSTFKLFLELIASLFIKLLESDFDEYQRFLNTELAINKLIYKREILGIRIDKELILQKCQHLEYEIFRIKNILQLEYNIFMPKHKLLQIKWLEDHGYKHLDTLLHSFKNHRNDNPVCSHFYELIRNQQDLESLLFISSTWGGKERTYPHYIGFGTITSRITLRQPALQNLRKENRDIILADKGKQLLYIDYSQFEAGILASLSDDEKLIKLYDSDIYKDLAKNVKGDENDRSSAKIIFYKYIYGDNSLLGKEKDYFSKFIELSQYKSTIENSLRLDKKIGTINGNFRLSTEDDCTWGLSHVIQATASLILKNALIRVNAQVPEAEFLIPMHDAALYQLPKLRYEEDRKKIGEIFIEEFFKVCPKIKTPKLNFDDFHISK